MSLGTDKPMDIFGGGWENYVEKIQEGFSRLTPDDVCVLCGDLSWAMSLEDSLEDFLFINKLPGKKIILKGNHDYWWTTAAKITAFFARNGIENIEILNNNCFYYNGSAICGTRGWMTESPEDTRHHAKIMAREAIRLRASLTPAGYTNEKLCFFHYPPRFGNIVCGEIVDVMNEFGIKKCWFGHIHGKGHRHAPAGVIDGIEYEMVSADWLNFEPRKII